MTAPDDETALLRLSVAIVLGQWSQLRELCLQHQPNRRWREAVLQTHLFAGIPRLVEAFNVIGQAGGLGPIEADEVAPEQSLAAQMQTGYELFTQIYAERAPEVREMLASFHPELERWVLGHAYGRVLSRPGLAPGVRETLAVVCLAALDQHRQLASHVRGAQRLGVDADDLQVALTHVADQLDPAALDNARQIVERFRIHRD
jgi:4-carboxymuconolactone decarboxylase